MFRILESIAVIEINKDSKKFNAKKMATKPYEENDLNELMRNNKKKGKESSYEEEKRDGS